MGKRTGTWKWLAVLLAAPLAVGCGGGDKKSEVDAARPAADAPALADTAVARDAAASDTAVAIDATIKLDTPARDGLAVDALARDALTVDAPAADAASGDVPVVTPDASADSSSDAEGEEAGLPCALVPAFKGGIITADLTLTRACSPYTIDKQIRVDGNATLTIEPGVTMMFDNNVQLTIAYNGGGRLVAVGTPTLPIVMTSSSNSPDAGDWAGITLYKDAMTGSKLGYVNLDYCGKANSGCIVGLTGMLPTALSIDHVTIDHVGVGADGIVEKGSDLAFAITNTTFKVGAIGTDNYAITLDAGSFAGIGAGNVFNGATINIVGGFVKNTSSWIDPGTFIVVTSTIRVEGVTAPILTIAPGTVMRFSAGVGLWVGYGDDGQLIATGTAAEPIEMTSDEHKPRPGDWSGISLWGGTSPGTKLAFLNLDYCGMANSACIDATVDVKSDGVTIDHVTINHVGEKANAIDENGTDSRFKITNCTFQAGAVQPGQYAIFVKAPSFAAIGTNNDFGGALINLDGGDIVATTSWSNPGTPIAVTRDIRVQAAATPVLTIGAGLVFKFDTDKVIWVGYGDPGRLVVNGTAAEHVKFTSLADAPSKGDWNGIIVWNTSQATLSYADIEYAGGYGNVAGGVAANSDKAGISMTNSSVSNSAGYGVYIGCDNASVNVTNSTFTNNSLADQGPGPLCP